MRSVAPFSRFRSVAVSVAFAAGLSGCNLGELTAPPVLSGNGFDWGLCSGAPEPVAAIQFTPATLTVTEGGMERVSLTLTGANGLVVVCPPRVTWSVADSAVATVTDGLVQSRALGKTFIRAKAGAKTDSVAVTVVPAPPAS